MGSPLAPSASTSTNVPDAPVPSSVEVLTPESDEPMGGASDDDGPAAYREDSEPPHEPFGPPAPQGLRQSAETAAGLHEFVVDHVSHLVPGIRIDQIARDNSLREQRLRQLDPNVLAAVIWGSWKTVTGFIGDPHFSEDESDFKLTVMQLIPFFTALSSALERNRFDQLIQVLEPNEPISVEADFLIFNRDDFLKREHLIEQKFKAVSLDKANGYTKNGRVGLDSISIAHDAQNISLDLGECGAVQAPLIAHLLQDSVGQRRFETLCVPGTVFYENVPEIVELYRRLLDLCKFCAGLHPYSSDECRHAHERERKLFSPTYGAQRVGNRTFWTPALLANDFHFHAQHYEHVYPGSVFLFQSVPPRIRHARKIFGGCEKCGLFHDKTDLPSSLHCPYNVPLIAQRFVKDFHAVEKSQGDPIVNDLNNTSDF